jgi:hypothetical protein
MVRFKLVLLGLLAVFAVGAVASASASADSCNGGAHFVFCTSPGNLPITHELVLGTGSLALFGATLTGAAAKFHCPTIDGHGKIELLGHATGLLYFLNCKMEKPAGCKLSAAQEAEIVVHYLSVQQSATLTLFTGTGGTSGEEFAAVEVETEAGKTCAAVETGKTMQTFPVTGKQMAKTPNGATGKLNQEISTTKAESVLKMGGNEASFSAKAEVHLGGVNAGSNWLVMAGV